MANIIGNPYDTMESELEAMVDTFGLEHVLHRLGHICFAKAEHVETNYMDARLARMWDTAGNKCEALSNAGSIKSVSPVVMR